MVDIPLNPSKLNHIYLICMYKEDFALNNLQWLICHKTKQNYFTVCKQIDIKLNS